MAKHKAQIMTFSPLGGSNWSVAVDGAVLGTYDTSGEVKMDEDGNCDMEDVELTLRRHFGIADDVECPEYPY
jgi:hypothetical protein